MQFEIENDLKISEALTVEKLDKENTNLSKNFAY